MHPLLRRQLRRLGLDPSRAPSPEQWSVMLERVDEVYEAADRDRDMLERSLAISSSEMQALYDDLRSSTDSELARQRDEMRQGLAMLEATLDAAVEGVILIGPAGDAMRHNRRFLEIFGVDDEVMVGATEASLLDHLASKLENVEVIAAHLGELHRDPRARVQDEIGLSDGRILERYSAAVMVGDDPRGRVWFFRDVTERRRLEHALTEMNQSLEARVRERTEALETLNAGLASEIEERQRAEAALRRAQESLRLSAKMEAVGRLAGGVAHDVNNMLGVMRSCARYLEEVVHDENARTEVAEIGLAADRAAELVRQLLALSREQATEPEEIDVGRAIEGARGMLARAVGEGIDLVVRCDAGPLVARLERGEIERAVLNLVVNSRDAMPDGGRIEIDLHRAVESLPIPGAAQSYLVIAVRDDGLGMDDEVRSRLFEPFFTTKPPGRGTGLGLPSVYAMVSRAGGHVAVESEPGQGSLFRLFLPEISGEGASTEDAPSRHRHDAPASASSLGERCDPDSFREAPG